ATRPAEDLRCGKAVGCCVEDDDQVRHDERHHECGAQALEGIKPKGHDGSLPAEKSASPLAAIPALVAGIQRFANAKVARRRGRAKLPAKEFAETWIPGTRPGMTRRLAWRLKLKFDVIPALVAGIQRSANATVARRRRRAKLRAKALVEAWIPGTRPGMTVGSGATAPVVPNTITAPPANTPSWHVASGRQ